MEGIFRGIECQLAQMNVFSHYCLTFSANDCVFSLNEQQKVYYNLVNPATPLFRGPKVVVLTGFHCTCNLKTTKTMVNNTLLTGLQCSRQEKYFSE